MTLSIRSTLKSSRLAQFAWFLVGYNILVIVWGALVRATGSGAGCGNHWPSCNGAVVPEFNSIHTVIELGHRISSTLDGFLVIILVLWVWRLYPRRHRIRVTALWSLIFVIIEGAIGAALVRLELVEDNASVLRAIVIAGHLANTLILLGWLTMTAWWISGGPKLRLTGRSSALISLTIGLVSMIILSAVGAVTALGDTLFPAETLAQGFQDDFSATASFLIRLRVWHPILAIAVAVYLVVAGNWLKGADKALIKPVNHMFAIIGLQMVAGLLNIILLVPIWMQILHLILADALWIGLVIVAAIGLREVASTSIMPQADLMLHARNGKHAATAFDPTKNTKRS